MCYINQTLDHRMYSWVGDDTGDVSVVLYCDADFAGEKFPGMKSTNGTFLCIEGPMTFCTLSGCSKKQGNVSKSTPEAEIVSASYGLEKTGLPALDLWEVLLRRKPLSIDLQEDNEACLQIMRTGRNPSMKHVSRTHGVNIAWLHAQYAKHFAGINCHTLLMCADIFTKALDEKAKWHAARKLIAHFT